QGAKLGDRVLDVIKWMDEDMQLTMPQIGPRSLVTAPIDVPAEAVHQAEPRCRSLGAGMSRMRIDPVLKGIDSGDPWENLDDGLQMLAAGTPRFGESVEFFEIFIAEQFHAHGGHFGE